MNYWTAKMVEARLAETVCKLDQPDAPRTNPSASDPALIWFQWLQPNDEQLLRMRVERRSWKQICRQFGISRSTAYRRQKYSLSLIAWKLNHDRVPTKWSRRFLLGRSGVLSSEM
jgi:hypothetical protein